MTVRSLSKGACEVISRYLKNEKLSPEDLISVEDEVAPFMSEMEAYLNGKKRGCSLERNLQDYAERLLESQVIDGTSFCIGDYGVVFQVECFKFQSIFSKVDDVMDPISYFLTRIMRETTGRDVVVAGRREKGGVLDIHLDIVY